MIRLLTDPRVECGTAYCDGELIDRRRRSRCFAAYCDVFRCSALKLAPVRSRVILSEMFSPRAITPSRAEQHVPFRLTQSKTLTFRLNPKSLLSKKSSLALKPNHIRETLSLQRVSLVDGEKIG